MSKYDYKTNQMRKKENSGQYPELPSSEELAAVFYEIPE
jgi:hypothetical protein